MIEVKEQSMNAQSPILVTLLGIVIEAKLEQLVNVPGSILLIPLGIVMEVNALQLKNAPPAISRVFAFIL